jgi:hypothetical protein
MEKTFFNVNSGGTYNSQYAFKGLSSAIFIPTSEVRKTFIFVL